MNANVTTQTKVVVHEVYEVFTGGGWIGRDGTYSFGTFQEAFDMAKEFKENPRSHNESMSDENVAYHQSREYTIQKKVTTTINIVTI